MKIDPIAIGKFRHEARFADATQSGGHRWHHDRWLGHANCLRQLFQFDFAPNKVRTRFKGQA